MEYFPFLLAIIIGLLIGLLGGGGSILAVPILVYVFHYPATDATGLSLFIVGITSLIGSINFFKNKLVDSKAVVLFGLPSVVAVLFARKIILPLLPDVFYTFSNFQITKSRFLLFVFAIFMLLAAYKMLKKRENTPTELQENSYLQLVLQGLIVGFITGLIGAGGGFLIVPALVLLAHLPIKKAIGSSLFIISANSLIGFGFTYFYRVQDWNFLLLFSAISIVGMTVGISISKQINSDRLRPIFAYFILSMGMFILIKEIFFQ